MKIIDKPAINAIDMHVCFHILPDITAKCPNETTLYVPIPKETITRIGKIAMVVGASMLQQVLSLLTTLRFLYNHSIC